MRYEAPQWDEAVRALATASEIAIACHVNPDGDALGSLFAAALALGKAGKKVWPSWGTEPAALPPQYEWMPGADLLVQPGEVPSGLTFLALDCGAADRLGSLAEAAASAPVLVNIDHHPGNPNFGTFNVVVPRASSTSELLDGILDDLGVELDGAIATCLYAGVVTDTGRFQYSNVTPDTLRLAARLMDHGVPTPEIALQVFESSPFSYLKLVGRVLERATLVPSAGFIYSWVNRVDLTETGVGLDETDKLIDVIRSTREADVAAIFKEQDDGRFRVSLRSKGPNVGEIARAHEGGGHDLAAGFTVDDRDVAVASIVTALSSSG